jgi:A/G-specific adenine glycosylase
VHELPYRKARAARKERFFKYYVVCDDRGMILRQRTQKDIWQKMFEFPMLEVSSSDKRVSIQGQSQLLSSLGVSGRAIVKEVHRDIQTLTHQKVHCTFYAVKVKRIPKQSAQNGCRFELFENLETFAFPKVIRTFLSGNYIHLMELPQNSKL